ncbi:transmembrane sensor [Paraburkholderia fungorum]|uniref:FecR family protein n=1 Tax=Paraburkholderia fungorum TaxID=134537 RepID=UPI00160C655A|nr:FecR domain-containing protein [Paraburkholderia fungorum]MBB4519732.1 transmembrane sensor [Paraburkholderia fungorum]
MNDRTPTPRDLANRPQPASTPRLSGTSKAAAPSYQSTDKPLEEVASRWVVLNTGGNPDQQEREAFSAWYAADLRHARAYDELLDIWRKLASVDAGAIRAKRRRRLATVPAAVTAFILAGSALLYYADSLRVAALADASTSTGEVRTVQLADGSSVTLDAQSAIVVDLRVSARNIRLLRGRALFDVAHDASRPFVVRTDNAEATALGTRFTVEALADHSRVAVLQSRVAVRCVTCAAPELTQILSPDYEADVGAAGVGGPQPANAAAIGGWSQGELTFENVDLRDALAELQRYTHRRIWLIDRSAGQRPVSGLIDPQHPEAAVRALAAAAKLEVRAMPGMLLVGAPKNIFEKG